MTDAISGAPDAELVARVLEADREAFAVVYDRYGAKLFDFAYSMLRHREDAADAVADSFVLFAERLPQLRDPDRLRPWLYAIVRSECLRRLKARTRVSYGDDEQLIAMADDARTPEEEAESAALRDLVWDAAAGLADRDRALLDLHLRQGLEGAELGEAMGVSASNAYVMLNRLKGQVDRSLGALLIARLGRDDCADLDALLADWDGTFSPLVRKRVARHVERCEVCSERRKVMLSPWALLGAVPMFAAPAALRDRVLNDTQLVAYAAPGAGYSYTGGGASGGALRGRRGLAAAAAAAVLIGGGAAWWANDAGGQPSSDLIGAPTVSATSDPTPTATPSGSSDPTPTNTASASPTPTATSTATADPAPGALAVTATVVDLGTSTAARSIGLRNTGGLPVRFAVDPDSSWIVVSPGTGAVEPGEDARISVRADHSRLVEGDASGLVRITWPDGAAQVRVTAREENRPSVGTPDIRPGADCQHNLAVVRVTDESRLTSVRVTWTGPSGTFTGAMTRVGGTDTWQLDLGQFTPGGDVTVRVTATDERGNRATGPRHTEFVAPCPG